MSYFGACQSHLNDTYSIMNVQPEFLEDRLACSTCMTENKNKHQIDNYVSLAFIERQPLEFLLRINKNGALEEFLNFYDCLNTQFEKDLEDVQIKIVTQFLSIKRSLKNTQDQIKKIKNKYIENQNQLLSSLKVNEIQEKIGDLNYISGEQLKQVVKEINETTTYIINNNKDNQIQIQNQTQKFLDETKQPFIEFESNKKKIQESFINIQSFQTRQEELFNKFNKFWKNALTQQSQTMNVETAEKVETQKQNLTQIKQNNNQEQEDQQDMAQKVQQEYSQQQQKQATNQLLNQFGNQQNPRQNQFKYSNQPDTKDFLKQTNTEDQNQSSSSVQLNQINQKPIKKQ